MSRGGVVAAAIVALVAGTVAFALMRPGAGEPVREPTHALLVLEDGSLVAEELASGDREQLAPAPHANAVVIDFAVGADGTIDDFTAMAYDDGAGPLGFLTYARRDGGPVRVNFVPTEVLPGRISNRGSRTISPDGRWLAYDAAIGDGQPATVLVSIAAEDGRLVVDDAHVLDHAVGPIDWRGATSDSGDVSRLTGRVRDGYAQLVLERGDDGFAVDEMVPVLADDPGGGRLLATTGLRAGASDDPWFELSVRRGPLVVGEPSPPDVATLRYHGASGRSVTTEFELGSGAGNPMLRAQGHHALVTVDHVIEPETPELRRGRAFVVRVVDGPGGGRFAAPVRLDGGPVGGALLGGGARGDD
ncbi:hypothetical protein [Egicoccus sp. AB-alg6-2]|uniref:hypothetical protein n=1 Tax=Egicoccus sp. AB-alg6-2 TaxID=3242692 RepID=UPI00359D0983